MHALDQNRLLLIDFALAPGGGSRDHTGVVSDGCRQNEKTSVWKRKLLTGGAMRYYSQTSIHVHFQRKSSAHA